MERYVPGRRLGIAGREYRLVELLSRRDTTYAEVWSAFSDDGREVAVKLVKPPPEGAEGFAAEFERHLGRELAFLSSEEARRCPNLVRLLAQQQTEAGPVLVLERMAGSLGEWLGEARRRGVSPPAAQLLSYGLQVAGGLEALHAAGFQHRDLKPSNVLVDADERQVKLADFGTVRRVTDQATGSFQGTLAWIAPEQALPARMEDEGAGPVARYAVDDRSDLYSLGLLLHALFVGHADIAAQRRIQDIRHRWGEAGAARHYGQVGGLAEEESAALRDVLDAQLGPAHDKALNRGSMIPGQPVPSATIGAGPASALALLIECLLDPQPDRRPAQAGAVRRTLAGILERVDQETPYLRLWAQRVAAEPPSAVHSPPDSAAKPLPWPLIALGVGVLAVVGAGVTAYWGGQAARRQPPHAGPTLVDILSEEAPPSVEDGPVDIPIAPATTGVPTVPSPGANAVLEREQEAAPERVGATPPPAPVVATKSGSEGNRSTYSVPLSEEPEREPSAAAETTVSAAEVQPQVGTSPAAQRKPPSAPPAALPPSPSEPVAAPLKPRRSDGRRKTSRPQLADAARPRPGTDPPTALKSSSAPLTPPSQPAVPRVPALAGGHGPSGGHPRVDRLRDPLGGHGQRPVMRRVPGGVLTMGSEAGDADERPVHRRSIRTFFMSETEVTVGQYRGFCTQSAAHPCPRGLDEASPDLPVSRVSWESAVAYTQWLSGATGQRYRLPSEAEWEWAARGGSLAETWWGGGATALVGGRPAENLGDRALASKRPRARVAAHDDGHAEAAPVGSFAPNPFGLYDVMGNLLEWTLDCAYPGYEGAPRDGSARRGDDGGDCSRAIARGASWYSPPEEVRVSNRVALRRSVELPMVGFRVVREP